MKIKNKGEIDMKKRYILLAAAILAMGIFGACGSSSQSTSSTQEKTEGKEITEEEAKKIAFEDAKVENENEVSGLRIQTDQEDMQKVYEIEFIILNNNQEYEYEILAQDGKILSKDVEEAYDENEKNFSNVQVEVTEEEAKNTVLEKVPGAKEENIRMELDNEDGIYVYEGDILYENKEYEFKINAETGMLMEWSEEMQ